MDHRRGIHNKVQGVKKPMKRISNNKEMEKILNDKDIRTVQLIYGNDQSDISVVIGTTHFSTMYIMKKELVLDAAAYMRNMEIAIFIYNDKDLPEAWKKSYAEAGIPEREWDRRTEFHPFNEMGEHFCIDGHFLEQIVPSGNVPFPVPDWKMGIIKWFRSKAVKNEHLLEALGE